MFFLEIGKSGSLICWRNIFWSFNYFSALYDLCRITFIKKTRIN